MRKLSMIVLTAMLLLSIMISCGRNVKPEGNELTSAPQTAAPTILTADPTLDGQSALTSESETRVITGVLRRKVEITAVVNACVALGSALNGPSLMDSY